MHGYVHHIPGRLRIKVRWTAQLAARMDVIRGLEGVETVGFNRASSSLLLTYVPEPGRGDRILGTLVALGVTGGEAPRPNRSGAPKVAKVLLKTLAGEVIGKQVPLGLGRVLLALV